MAVCFLVVMLLIHSLRKSLMYMVMDEILYYLKSRCLEQIRKVRKTAKDFAQYSRRNIPIFLKTLKLCGQFSSE